MTSNRAAGLAVVVVLAWLAVGGFVAHEAVIVCNHVATVLTGALNVR